MDIKGLGVGKWDREGSKMELTVINDCPTRNTRNMSTFREKEMGAAPLTAVLPPIPEGILIRREFM